MQPEFLDHQRQILLLKIDGLDRAQLVGRIPSSTLMRWILLHLVEEAARQWPCRAAAQAIDDLTGE